jgi:Ser/Thr protein kinase RdoA (MazF antagonist)
MTGQLVPSEDTARYICRRFAVPAREPSLTAVARGLCGRVWRLDTGAGRYAVKELFWDDDQDEDEIAQRVAFEGAARAAGVRCPVSLPTTSGGYLCRLPPDLGDIYVRLYSWVDGSPVGPSREIARWSGAMLGRLHAMKHPADGPPDAKFDTVPTSAQWREVMVALGRRRVPWLPRLRDRLPHLERLSALIAVGEPDELVMCHLDFTPSNVMRDRADGLVLIDWDNAGPGRAEHELGQAVLDWHLVDGHPDPAGVRAFLAAYREAGGVASLTGRSAFTGYVASAINHVYTQATVAVATDVREEHRRLAHDKARAALACLPTVDLLERTLELVVNQHD